MKPLEIKPATGGRLMTNVSSEAAGVANYTRKKNWRRYMEREMRAEGHDWFFPNPESWANSDAHLPGVTDPIILVAMARQPNGRIAVVAGTQTTLWRFYGVDDPAYVHTGYVRAGYFETPGTWVQIGSGFSAAGKSWEALNLNGWLVLNNGVDLPLTYRVQDLRVKPIYELREAGVACVGTIARHSDILHCLDVTVIESRRLKRLLSAVPLKTHKAQTGLVRAGAALAVINSGAAGVAGHQLSATADVFAGKVAGDKIRMQNGQVVTIASVASARSVTLVESVLVEPNQPLYFPSATGTEFLIPFTLDEIIAACNESSLTTAALELETATAELATATAAYSALQAVYVALQALRDGDDSNAALTAAEASARTVLLFNPNNTSLLAAIAAADAALLANPDPTAGEVAAALAAANAAHGTVETKTIAFNTATTDFQAAQSGAFTQSDAATAAYFTDRSKAVGLKLYWATGEVRTIVGWAGDGDLIVTGCGIPSRNGRYVRDAEDSPVYSITGGGAAQITNHGDYWILSLSGSSEYRTTGTDVTAGWFTLGGEDGGVDPAPSVRVDSYVKLDSDIPVASGLCSIENPLAYAAFDETQSIARYGYRDLFGMPFYPRRWGPSIPVTIDPVSNVVLFEYPVKSVEELNGTNFLLVGAGTGGTNLFADAVFTESNKIVVAGDITTAAKVLSDALATALANYELAAEVSATAVSTLASAKLSLAAAQAALATEVPDFATLTTAVETAQDNVDLALQAVEVANADYITAQQTLAAAQTASEAAPGNAALAAAVVAATQAVSAAQQLYQTANVNYTVAQNALLIAQGNLNANPKTAALVAAVTLASAQVQAAAEKVASASAALALSAAAKTAAEQNVLPTDTLMKAADADAAGIAYEDLIDDGSPILKALELKNVLVIYKDGPAIFIAAYTANVEQPYAFTRIEIPANMALAYRNTLIAVKSAHPVFKLNGTSHLYAGRDSFFSFDLVTQMPSEVPEMQLCQDVFFQNTPDPERAFACDNEVTRELWFRPNTEAGTETLRLDYKFGTLATTDVELYCGAMALKPMANHRHQDKWFLMGGAAGTLFRYGRASETVRRSGATTGTLQTQTYTENTLYWGAADPNGSQSGSIGDEYNQIISGAFVKQWIKVTGNSTDTGWV